MNHVEEISKEKIGKALRLWTEGMEKKYSKNEGNEEMTRVEDEEADQTIDSNLTETKEIPIEVHVARYLLTFDDLDRVWLGTRTCCA
ncbi:hypothetical protein BGX21_001765 [Mortierella sp. AD011]|nr:hypothetical protein BGX21_001765 [Mortierella sp. AD011]